MSQSQLLSPRSPLPEPDSYSPSARSPAQRRLRVRMPENVDDPDQDAEWCMVDDGTGWRRLRLHDYAAIFNTPGLYEHLFAERLACDSPRIVVSELARVAGDAMHKARVLELGAGNGMVGEQLKQHGAGYLCGLDILPEAKRAAHRDRPSVYADYVVGDLTTPDATMREQVLKKRFDALVCVAALGFGDIPAEAFRAAFSTVRTGGLVAFNIRDKFLSPGEETGFSQLVTVMEQEGFVKIHRRRQYCHRLTTGGKPLHYVALVGEKCRELPG